MKRGGNEVIVVSRGIGFKYKKNDHISSDEIEKVYILDTYAMLEHFSYLIAQSNAENIILVNAIVSYAEQQLNIKVSDYLNLTLLDHIDFLLKRAVKEQFVKSPLYWNVKRFYPKFFAIGLHALTMIEEKLQISLPEDEAVSLALHFVNMQGILGGTEETIQGMHILKNIMTIIQVHYKIQLNEESTPFIRLTTHLQFFIQRLLKKEEQKDDIHTLELYKQIRTTHLQSYECVQKIKIYIESRFDTCITANEETYLMLHISHVVDV